jgi:hypothetical protein
MTLVTDVLTQAQIDQLRQLAATARAGDQSASGTWTPVYQALYSFITVDHAPVAGVDKNVWLWIGGARFINNNDGPFANLIREYTAIQYKLRYGDTLDFTELNAASNNIGSNFIKEWIPLNSADQASAVVPNISVTGNNDAGPVAATVFNRDGGDNSSPWAGTVFFTMLGDPEFFQRWVLDALNDPTKPAVAGQTVETGGYDLISVAQSIQEFALLGGSWTWESFFAAGYAGYNMLEFDSIRIATLNETNARFTQ